MKKLAIIPVAVLATALMAFPVYAEENQESPEGDVISGVTYNNSDITNDIRIDATGIDDVDNNIAAAASDIHDTNDTNGNYRLWLLPNGEGGTIESEMQSALTQEGSSLTPQQINSGIFFDISYVPGGVYQEIDGTITITMDIDEYAQAIGYPNSIENTFVILLHNEDTDSWEVIVPIENADGTYTFTVDSLSPFIALFGDKGSIATPTPTAAPTATPTPATVAAAGTTSPQTGESAGAYLLIVAASLAVAGFVCIKRSVTSVK
ncbi:MAG: hypothetical protein K6F49_01765 [Saccharofermentans sp.]|nr:hypothetical protein [Saccharofermentans sp.]